MNVEHYTMKLSKNFKKILFFWVIFHAIGYLSFLLNIHPSIKNNNGSQVETYYILTPEIHLYGTELMGDASGFFPLQDLTEESYGGGYTYFMFLGIYGYYGHNEFLFYVVLPLFIIFLVWVYRRFIA